MMIQNSTRLVNSYRKHSFPEVTKKSEIKIQIDRAACQDRNELLRYKDRTLKAKIPCILTYNTQLPNVKESINKHWNILKINPWLETIFNEKPSMAFRRNRNVRDIIGQKTILHDKVLREIHITNRKGWCSPCNNICNNLCCNQIGNTNEFTSNITNEKFKIYHHVNCKSKFIIYLLELQNTICGKSEWPMNFSTETMYSVSILVCQHFKQRKENKEEEREDFWIKKLKTLHPNGFNQELNRNE